MARDRLVFEGMILMWLAAWSITNPLVLISEFHTADHPLVQNFGCEEGNDLTKLLHNRFAYPSSEASWGLQVADIAASIVYQAVHDLSNYGGRLPFFRLLMQNSMFGRDCGPGLMTLPECGGAATDQKYSFLSKVMPDRRSFPPVGPPWGLITDGDHT